MNHPIHIYSSDNSISPSSFIPFCGIGGNMSIVGKKHLQFPFPMCTAFERIIFYGQNCYSLELNKFQNQLSKRNEKAGLELNLLLDYNPERQTYHLKREDMDIGNGIDPFSQILSSRESPYSDEALIYFSTLGTICS